MTEELVKLTASEAAAAIARGAISAEDYTRACLERIEARDGEIKAFAHLDRDHALAQARKLDERRLEGHPLGPLHGIPVAIKDIIDTADYPTELGSPLAAGRRTRHDATVVAKLRAAGAVIIGKTVITEFAYFQFAIKPSYGLISRWTLSGLPALSLPLFAGEGGLPHGAQLVGPPGRDGRLLRTATALIEMLRETKKGSRSSRAKIRS